MNIHDLSVDLGELPTRKGLDDTEVENRKKRPHHHVGIWFASARRQIQRQDAREQAERMRAGIWPSYTFAVKDGDRWRAGVMLKMGEPGRYRRKTSVALFATDTDAMAAAEQWRRELEKPR